MAIFQYRAIFNNKKIKGFLNADSMEDAKNILHQKKTVVVKLDTFFIKKSSFIISKKELFLFTKELFSLLKAGLNLYESLLILKEKHTKNMYILLLDLCDQIKMGKSFSKSIFPYKKIFDPLYFSMIKNGEKSGRLASTLEEIVNFLEKQKRLKSKILKAVLYPSILFIFCFSIFILLIFFVMPSLFDLFDGKSLHPITNIVLSFSKFLNSIKNYLILFFFLFLGFLISCYYSSCIRKKMFIFFLTLPMLKKFFIKVAIIRFSRAFSSLIASGLSYLEALKLSKEVMKHPILEKDIFFAEKKVMEGEKLSIALKKSNFMPKLFIRFLEIAEESAKTSSMLYHVSKIYEDEVEEKLTKFTTILQPLFLLLLGFIVGIIVLSVLLPLTDVSSFAM